MPTIDLTRDELAKPTPFTLAKIEATMLWPDDTEARERFDQTVRADYAVKMWPDAEVPVDRQTIAWLIGAPRLVDVRKRATDRYKEGCLIGHMLCELIDRPAGAVPAKNLTEAKRRAAAAFREMLGTKRARWAIEPLVKMIDNHVWRRFKPSAHLWAAYIARVRRGRAGNAFPCVLGDLADFAALAALMLREGAAYKAERAPPLLNADIAWTLPPHVIALLPEIALE